MRRLTGAVFQSLDGVMQGPGGPTEDPTGGFDEGGWITGYFDEVTGAAAGRLFAAPYALLLGRRTYDIFAAYWPYVEGEEAAMGEALTAADKYVLTRGDAPLEWANSHRLAAAPALFYADWVYPIPAGPLRDYRARLRAHPAVARVVDEARPYRHLFPLGAPDRD